MAEYLKNEVQLVPYGQAAIFENSIPCNKGYVFHEDGTGIFTLRGVVNNPYACFARYQVTFNGNIAIPEGGDVAPIAISLAVNGETRPTSRAIVTPAAAEEYFNVTSTALITVPKGCCYSVSVRNVAATDDPTIATEQPINIQNANIVINRVA